MEGVPVWLQWFFTIAIPTAIMVLGFVFARVDSARKHALAKADILQEATKTAIESAVKEAEERTKMESRLKKLDNDAQAAHDKIRRADALNADRYADHERRIIVIETNIGDIKKGIDRLINMHLHEGSA